MPPSVSAVATFDKSQLKKAETVVKNKLPTASDIAAEKQPSVSQVATFDKSQLHLCLLLPSTRLTYNKLYSQHKKAETVQK